MYKYILNRANNENTQVYGICDDIRRHVKQSKIKPTIYDYPAVVVGCYSNYYKLYVNTTHSRPDYSQTPVLKSVLKKLGTIGQKRNNCDNIIGACAEPKAVHYALLDQHFNMNYIHFTKAFRPRTGEVIKYCKNCKDAFGI